MLNRSVSYNSNFILYPRVICSFCLWQFSISILRIGVTEEEATRSIDTIFAEYNLLHSCTCVHVNETRETKRIVSY